MARRPPREASSRVDLGPLRLAPGDAFLRYFRSVAHRVAQEMHHGILERLEHLPVHLDVEADAAHMHVPSRLPGDLAHHVAEAAEHRFRRYERDAVDIVAHLARGLLDGPARLSPVARQGGQPAEQGFQALVEIAQARGEGAAAAYRCRVRFLPSRGA